MYLRREKAKEKNFFLFYNRKKDKQEVKITDLITEMISLANEKRNQEKVSVKREKLN